MENQENPKNQGNISEEESKEKYEFLQEKFKDEEPPIRRRTLWKYAGLGLVIGIAASLSFFALKPWISGMLEEDAKEINIPEEEEILEEEIEEIEVTIDNYRELNQVLCDVGEEASKCVVELRAEKSEDDWQEKDYDLQNSVSGIIVADNGVEYLIFGSSRILPDAKSIQATFVDEKRYEVKVKQKDDTLGYAVYSVHKDELSEGTRKKIQVATLGSTGSTSKGDPIIALGSPFGYGGGMGFGVIASPKNSVYYADGEYRVICTDITGTEAGTGILVNIQGEVVGIIDQSISDKDSVLITGYGISDLKHTIEFLSNGETVPYLGINGVTVTEEVREKQGIPVGIYVKSVDVDSPAMNAGIQSGDVIIGIAKEEVNSLRGYHAVLMKQKSEQVIELRVKRKGADDYADIEYKVTVGSHNK